MNVYIAVVDMYRQSFSRPLPSTFVSYWWNAPDIADTAGCSALFRDRSVCYRSKGCFVDICDMFFECDAECFVCLPICCVLVEST